MYIYILLSISILIQFITVLKTLQLLGIARSRKSWILIAIAFFLISFNRVVDLADFAINGNIHNGYYYFIDIIISTLILVGVITIGKVLKQLKKSEVILKESEEKFRTLFNDSTDGIFLLDLDGNIIESNLEVCKQLGYSKEELINTNIRKIKTPKYIDQVKYNIDLIVKNGRHTYDTEHFTKDNKILYLEMISRTIDYEGRTAILTIAHDISERFKFERKILSATIETEERERKRFAKEMHDGIGPLLSTIKLYVNILKEDDLAKDDKLSFIKNINEIIDEAMLNIRDISNNLVPILIKDYGLSKAIDSLCSQINLTGKIKLNFMSNINTDRLDSKIELALFRIIEELINNTIKHADAKNVDIALNRSDSDLLLKYADDGVGFDMDEILKSKQPGTGLKNIVSRVISINGQYSFMRSRDRGFTMMIEAKLK